MNTNRLQLRWNVTYTQSCNATFVLNLYIILYKGLNFAGKALAAISPAEGDLYNYLLITRSTDSGIFLLNTSLISLFAK